jgi:ribosomal protein S18 acetylase RimI-like enzyme
MFYNLINLNTDEAFYLQNTRKTPCYNKSMEKESKLNQERKENLNLSFKKATQEDLEDFLKLEHIAAESKMYSAILNKDEALKEFAENEVYLIYKGKQLVGTMGYKIKSPEHAYLGLLVVHPDFRGQGIAREAALFRLNKLKGIKRIDLVTHPENSKIINLYQSLGFKIEKRVENYFGDGEPRLMLVKEN